MSRFGTFATSSNVRSVVTDGWKAEITTAVLNPVLAIVSLGQSGVPAYFDFNTLSFTLAGGGQLGPRPILILIENINIFEKSLRSNLLTLLTISHQLKAEIKSTFSGAFIYEQEFCVRAIN
jgi:hypothetical protein